MNDSELQHLLAQIQAGDLGARSRLFQLTYSELNVSAARLMARQSARHTLQATALVHEVFFRIRALPVLEVNTRGDFVKLANVVMRSVLVDHARGHLTQKRSYVRSEVPPDTFPAPEAGQSFDAEALDIALRKLRLVDAMAAELVRLRYFAHLSAEETAQVLNIPLRTMHRRWVAARAWLHRELAP